MAAASLHLSCGDATLGAEQRESVSSRFTTGATMKPVGRQELCRLACLGAEARLTDLERERRAF